MFARVVESTVAMTDDELDEALRASELMSRDHAARHAVLIAVAEARGTYRVDGHRTIKAYLRASCNTAGATIARDRKLARLVNAHPSVGEALLAGHISVDHAVEIARVHTNPRIGNLLISVVSVLVEQAEHRSYDEFRVDIDQFVNAVDQDGAYAHVANNVEQRNARVNDVAGCADIVATGGDPITAAQLVAIFDSFVHGEFQREVGQRTALYGDEADQHPLARTAAQRRFDALVTIFGAAAASPTGCALPEPTLNVIIDQASLDEAFTRAAIVLPNGNQLDVDELAALDATLLTTLADELVDDPEAFRSRRYETSTGAAIPAFVALQVAMAGHIRRVVVDSNRVVIDYGTRQRLFTGNARLAAQLMTRYCSFPGCRLPSRLCQIDHNDEWNQGGPTDQSNANVECGPHNRYKNRTRLRTRKDACGRTYHLKPDGTIILPAGERPPDLSTDEMNRAIRARLTDISL